jgi:hypothetical protein
VDAAIVNRWNLFHGAVREVYDQTDLGLEYKGSVVAEAELETLAARSEDLTTALREELGRGGDRESAEVEELETATLASAAIDVAVAGDVLDALRQEVEGEAEWLVPAAVEEAAPLSRELDSVSQLLARADDTFPEEMGMIAGRAPGPLVAERRARRAIDELTEYAARPATKFGTGLLAVGVSQLLVVLGEVEGIHSLISDLPWRARSGFKLVNSGTGKLTALAGGDRLIDATNHLVLDQVADSLEQRTTPVGEKILRWTVRVRRCDGMIRENLADGVPDTRRLDAELARLCDRYDKNMRWGRIIGKGLGWCAPCLIALSGGVGVPLVAGANGVGLVAVIFTLADRLDTVPALGRVDGVPRIVSTCLE